MARTLGDADYRELLRLRTGLRQFLHLSEDFAREIGLTPAQHQLLLVVRGHSDPAGPTIGDVASYLLLRHHSAVELVDRAVTAGLVRRTADPNDGRAVRLSLTPAGNRSLEQLSELNLDELRRLAEHFRPLFDDIDAGHREMDVSCARVDDPPRASGRRLLVDRLWPRGLPKEGSDFEWRKDLAPSTELRRWYGHDPERFEEFSARYADELAEREEELRALVEETDKPIIFLTATKDLQRSSASVLAGEIIRRRGLA